MSVLDSKRCHLFVILPMIKSWGILINRLTTSSETILKYSLIKIIEFVNEFKTVSNVGYSV